MRRMALAVALCSLWFLSTRFSAAVANEVHFHHVHLNVVNPKVSSDFYRDIFGAVPVRFNNRSDAVFTERSFFLFTRVPQPASWDLNTGIWHLGWGGVDGPREYNTLTGKGVQFQTPVSPLGNYHYMYAFGPDKEVLEVWTGYQNHRYGHVHLMSPDPVGTVRWYANTFGIGIKPQTLPPGTAAPAPGAPPFLPEPGPTSAGSGALEAIDNVNFVVFRQPTTTPVPPLWAGNAPVNTIQPTKGRAVDHIAFSYRRIQPVFDQMKKAGLTIVEPITLKPEFGFKSFFVLGPDQVLIEIVEAKPIPDSSWE